MTTGKITPKDTYSVFIGSGALSYPWYERIAFNNLSDDSEPLNDWSVTFSLPDDEEDTPGERYTLNHASIMRAVHRIVRGQAKGVHLNGPVRRECRKMLRDVDDCDFDADLADCVMQSATLGDVVYG